MPRTGTPTAGCRSGERMTTRPRHTSCCTLPRTTRLPRHHPHPPVGCRTAHTPSCSTTVERQSFEQPERTVSCSQSAPQPPPGTAASSGLGSGEVRTGSCTGLGAKPSTAEGTRFSLDTLSCQPRCHRLRTLRTRGSQGCWDQYAPLPIPGAPSCGAAATGKWVTSPLL